MYFKVMFRRFVRNLGGLKVVGFSGIRWVDRMYGIGY